jgi:hypothetical protein
MHSIPMQSREYMNQRKLAEARRLYHHVINGGTLTANDVSFMVVALEEAHEEIENMETGTIQVKRLEENEDGSANLEIVTDVEATRLLVEVGLTRLLEMAIDKENEEYEFRNETKEGVAEIVKGSVQQEMGEGSEAAC